MTERRYDDREVALILKATAESGARRPGTASSDGLTLAELKDIAAEVGLDPSAVERAAGALDVRPTGRVAALFGGKVVSQYERIIDAQISEEDHQSLVLAIRRAMGRQGVVGTELDGLEWKARDGVGGRYVSVHRQGDRTVVSVLGNFRDGAAALFLMNATMGGVISLAVLKKTALLAALGLGVGPLVVAAMFAPAWGLWRWWSRREDAALRRTLQAVVQTIEQRQRARIASGGPGADQPDE